MTDRDLDAYIDEARARARDALDDDAGERVTVLLAQDVLDLADELDRALIVARALGEGLRRARHAA